MSRRRLASLIGGGALAGAIWTTGLTVMARGRHPQFFVLGRDEWQVVLLEHGPNRVLLLLGEFERSPEPDIDLLCGLLRQHIDVVIGDADGLRRLSPTFRERRTVSMFIETGSWKGGAGSTRYLWLIDPITLRAGALTVTIEPLPDGEWQASESRPRGWIAHATVSDLTVALARSIESIAAHARPDSMLAIAPQGDVAALWRAVPGMAIATNIRAPFDAIDPGESIGSPRVLVRTFPQDIAAFIIKDGRLHMPGWAEREST